MSQTTKAYLLIKEKLLNGSIKNGEMLSERVLSEKLSIGRMPVREAIKDLIREELLWTVPGRGAYVRQLSADEVQELYEARYAIEGMAAYLAAMRGDKEEIKTLGRAIKEEITSGDSDSGQLQALGAELHSAIFRAAANRELDKMHKHLHNKMVLNMRLSRMSNTVRIQDSAEEHLDIVEAVISGDSKIGRASCREGVYVACVS